MGGDAAEEGSDGSVEEQANDYADPDLLQPEKVGKGAGQQKQGQVPAGLIPALQVAAAGKLAQLRAFDGTAVPLDPKVLAYVSQRPVAHGLSSS